MNEINLFWKKTMCNIIPLIKFQKKKLYPSELKLVCYKSK